MAIKQNLPFRMEMLGYTHLELSIYPIRKILSLSFHIYLYICTIFVYSYQKTIPTFALIFASLTNHFKVTLSTAENCISIFILIDSLRVSLTRSTPAFRNVMAWIVHTLIRISLCNKFIDVTHTKSLLNFYHFEF